MTSQVYSREYLQGIPEQRKQQFLDAIVSSFLPDIHTQAALGKTSYLYKHTASTRVNSHPPPPTFTNDELLQGLQTRFPGCKVTYQEITKVEEYAIHKNIINGFLIDWS